MKNHIKLFFLTTIFVACGRTPSQPLTETPELPEINPVQDVAVSGSISRLGSFLKGDHEIVPEAGILTVNITDFRTSKSNQEGSYTITIPSNNQNILATSKLGYHLTYTEVTTENIPVENEILFAAEGRWIQSIADTYRVNITTRFPCAPTLGSENLCVYGIVVGQIVLNGSPVEGIPTEGWNVFENQVGIDWPFRGPCYLNADGSPGFNTRSNVSVEGGQGGFFVLFVEIPGTLGPIYRDITITVDWDGRLFSNKVWTFRANGVTWTSLEEI